MSNSTSKSAIVSDSVISIVDVMVFRSVMLFGTSVEPNRSTNGSSMMNEPTYSEPGVP